MRERKGPLQKQASQNRASKSTWLGQPGHCWGKTQGKYPVLRICLESGCCSQAAVVWLKSSDTLLRGLIVHCILRGPCELERAVISDPKIRKLLRKVIFFRLIDPEATEGKGWTLVKRFVSKIKDSLHQKAHGGHPHPLQLSMASTGSRQKVRGASSGDRAKRALFKCCPRFPNQPTFLLTW